MFVFYIAILFLCCKLGHTQRVTPRLQISMPSLSLLNKIQQGGVDALKALKIIL